MFGFVMYGVFFSVSMGIYTRVETEVEALIYLCYVNTLFTQLYFTTSHEKGKMETSLDL